MGKLPAEGDGATIIVADDSAAHRTRLQSILTLAGYQVLTARDGQEALDLAFSRTPDLVLLDVAMPRLSGLEVCKRLRQAPQFRETPVVLVTPRYGPVSKVESIEADCDDLLTKPVDAVELVARVRSLLRLRRLREDLTRTERIVLVLARAVEAKTPDIQGHLERIASYAEMLGREVGLSGRSLREMRFGMLLHDIGKIGVPDAILEKAGALTPEEYEVVKRHPAVGFDICRPLVDNPLVLDAIRHHHERWDGKGYPDGLKGDAIPMVARITTVVDSYDAMTSDRSYQQARTQGLALAELRSQAGRQFDPALVDAFRRAIEQQKR
ncbi:MAG: response regulator [Dehalococcoidia bacterium]|nr:response regulator [Dehalococcoidia bacterium]